MGKKSTPEVPEAYALEDLLKYNTDLNRFDSVNPFGTQKWSQDGDKWTMTQAPSEEFQGLIDKQLDFVNRGNQRTETPGPMKDMYQALMDRRSNTVGATPGYHPDVPQQQAPTPQGPIEGIPAEGMMPGQTDPNAVAGPATTDNAQLSEAIATAMAGQQDQGSGWDQMGRALGNKYRGRR